MAFINKTQNSNESSNNVKFTVVSQTQTDRFD